MAFLIPAAAGAAGAAAGGGSSILGSLLSVAGTGYSGIAGMQQAQYQAEIAEMNAEIERNNADRVRDAAQIEQQQADIDTAGLLGQQFAAQSASGIDVGSRSHLGARKAARALGRRDALNIRHAAEVEATDRLNQASAFDASASAHRSAGRSAIVSSFIGGAGSLIGSASSVSPFARRRIVGGGIPRSRSFV